MEHPKDIDDWVEVARNLVDMLQGRGTPLEAPPLIYAERVKAAVGMHQLRKLKGTASGKLNQDPVAD